MMEQGDVSGWTFKHRKVLVRLSLIPLLTLFVFERPLEVAKELWVVLLSCGFVVLGVSLRLWATFHIGGRKSQTLIVGGPYALCRNPLYLGSFFAVLGVLGLGQAVLTSLLCLLLIFFIFHATVLHEEKVLAQRFGDAYRTYSQRVPRFVPRLWFRKSEEPDEKCSFEPRFVRRELGNAAAFLLACGVAIGLRLCADWLQLKAWWPSPISLE